MSYSNGDLTTDAKLAYQADSVPYLVATVNTKNFNFIDGRPEREHRWVVADGEVRETASAEEFSLDIPAGAWCKHSPTGRVFQMNPPANRWYESKPLWLLFVILITGATWAVRRGGVFLR